MTSNCMFLILQAQYSRSQSDCVPPCILYHPHLLYSPGWQHSTKLMSCVLGSLLATVPPEMLDEARKVVEAAQAGSTEAPLSTAGSGRLLDKLLDLVPGSDFLAIKSLLYC